MKYMLPNELEELIREYDYATGLSDSQIKEKLRKIEDCYNECSSNEKVFADAITVLFCRTIGILRKQLLSAEAAANIPRDPVDDPDHSYSATCSCDYDCIPFSDGNSLRIAFYNYFRNEKKKNGKVLNIIHCML